MNSLSWCTRGIVQWKTISISRVLSVCLISRFLTWTIFGICLPVTNRPSRSITINIRSLNHPDLRPNGVHSIAVTRTAPSDLTGKVTRSLSSPTLRHLDGSLCFCLLIHHHQMKKTAVPAPTAAAVTYASRVLSENAKRTLELQNIWSEYTIFFLKTYKLFWEISKNKFGSFQKQICVCIGMWNLILSDCEVVS